MKRDIVLIIHNVRSAHNVGSMLRTADGLGVKQVLISGYSPYPTTTDDKRLPHIAQKVNRSISKTSLGAETSVDWQHTENLPALIDDLLAKGYIITALEQISQAIQLNIFKPPLKIALIVGNEVEGIDPPTLKLATTHLFIPMLGDKESFNVSVAAAMALYHLRYG